MIETIPCKDCDTQEDCIETFGACTLKCIAFTEQIIEALDLDEVIRKKLQK